MAVQAVPAVEPVAPGDLRLSGADVSLDLGVDALADELVIREPGSAAGKEAPPCLRGR